MFLQSPIVRSVLFLAGALAATPAWSAGPYFGFTIGEAELEEDAFCGAFAPSVSCDDTDTATKFILGYRPNDNFAIEGFWADLGEVEATDSFGDSLSFEVNGFGVAGLGIVPATERVDIFGKFGLYSWDGDATANISGTTFSGSDDGTDPLFGFGVRGRVGERFGLRAEWERFDIDGDDITVLSVGGEIHF